MSIGSSGRIVIEMDQELKKELYSSLTKEGITMKEWFVKSVENYLANTSQLNLAFDNQPNKESINEQS
jgi:hypothetical protein